jgi:hypothetical protein
MTDKQQTPKPEKKPNEVGPIQVSAHLKIYDPKTKDVILEKKG